MADIFIRLGKNYFYWYTIIFFLVIAVFLRTSNFKARVSVQADNARDVQVAKYAADHLKLPQIGQFSSAGPFFYGPWYYWILEFYSFMPFGFLTHWYMTTIVYILFVTLSFYLGFLVDGKRLGLFALIFAAISPAQVTASFGVWNPTIIPILVLLSLIFLVRFYYLRSKAAMFLLGFLNGLAITIHLQSMLTLPTLAVAIFLIPRTKRTYAKYLLILFIGFLIPFLPLLYFDLKFNWVNSRSFLIYLLVDQYRIWVPNRWLTYVFSYWPLTWAQIVGGVKIMAGIIMIALSVLFIARLRSFKRYQPFYLVAITFCLEVVLFRYYRGERFEYYSFFAHPTVIFLSAWVVSEVFKVQRLLGIAFVFIIIASTLDVSLKDIARMRRLTLTDINTLKETVYQKYPNDKFDIYGCLVNASSISHPLALSMYYDGRNDVNGIKIGVCESTQTLSWIRLTNREVRKDNGGWFNKSTQVVYEDTAEWWKEKPPVRGEGNFWKFIRGKLSPACYPYCP